VLHLISDMQIIVLRMWSRAFFLRRNLGVDRRSVGERNTRAMRSRRFQNFGCTAVRVLDSVNTYDCRMKRTFSTAKIQERNFEKIVSCTKYQRSSSRHARVHVPDMGHILSEDTHVASNKHLHISIYLFIASMLFHPICIEASSTNRRSCKLMRLVDNWFCLMMLL
jgi:hypothetical protein